MLEHILSPQTSNVLKYILSHCILIETIFEIEKIPVKESLKNRVSKRLVGFLFREECPTSLWKEDNLIFLMTAGVALAFP